jgi:putative ABC transport system permease protein
MDKIILILIFCAMLLAATVLYNLADINITERQRELASLKVLGFYDKETAAYIFRETFALTLIGLIPGAIFGKLLHSYLISAIEIDVLMFVRELSPGAVLYGSLLTVLFSLLVSGALYFKLIKIDPAVSLKSVE